MSYRQSLYPGGPSSLGTSNSGAPSTMAINSLVDKQRQVEHFHQILSHSQQLLTLYKGYADKYNVLVGGSEAVGDVVEHWQNVFRSTSLALGSIHSQKQEQLVQLVEENPAEGDLGDPTRRSTREPPSTTTTKTTTLDQIELPKNAKPDQLVRLPVVQP